MFRIWLVSLLIAVTIISGCGGEGSETASTPVAATEAPTAAAAPAIAEVFTSELSSTAWRLLNIAEMDDSTDYPDDPSKYTLEFAADGSASMRADCNRGSGNWTSESAGQLTFGPIAATMAMCPPGSLADKYLAQFQWVRSYVLREGHLFLATMADGAIIEFDPLPAVVASLFGAEIRAADAVELQNALITRVFDHYAAENQIMAEGTEIDILEESMRRGMEAEGLNAEADLTPEQVAELGERRRQMAAAMIRQWKINKSLHQTYGGRIIYQQLGPEPLDAYRKYLDTLTASGDLAITDPAMAEAFWAYFTDESRHQFMEAGSADEAKAFATPPWEIPAQATN